MRHDKPENRYRLCYRCGREVARGGRNHNAPRIICQDCRLVDPKFYDVVMGKVKAS